MAYRPKRTRFTQINSLFGSPVELPINQLPLGRDICQFIYKCKHSLLNIRPHSNLTKDALEDG